MAVARMKRVEVVGHLDCKEDALRALQRLGVVEIEDVTQTLLEGPKSGSGDESASLGEVIARDSDSDLLIDIEADIARVRSSLELIERFSPRQRAFIEQFAGYQIPLTQQELEEFESDTGAVQRITDHAEQLEQRYSELIDRQNGLVAAIDQVTPWNGLEVPVEMLAPTRNTSVFVGSVAAGSGAVDELSESLVTACRGEAVAHVIATEEHLSRVAVVVHRDHERDVLSLLRSHDFSPQSFPFSRGHVVDFLTGAAGELRRVRVDIDKVAQEAKELADERARLSAVLDRLETERDRLLIAERLVRTEKAFGLVGWVKADDCSSVEKSLSEVDDTLVFVASDPDPGEEPPVVLTNNRLSRPFEVVLQLYSMPRRIEIDPSLFVSFFFALFFAMAVADAGYGIALAVLCYVLLRTVRMSDLGKKTFELLFIAGVATIVVGFVTGGLFGTTLDFALVNPVEQPIVFLLISFGVGIIHLYVGMAIEFYENVKQRRIIAGILDQGLWVVLLTSLLIMLVQWQAAFDIPYSYYARYAALIGAVGLIATQGRHQKNPLLRIGSGLASLYDIFSYLSDILSYSRLLGLGMASGVIASVINLVAGMFWSTPVVGPIIAIAILLGGHLFNLFIGVIGAYVHVSRLHYVEFFNKFFEGGGRAFSPFRVNSRHVYVKEAEQQGGSV